MTTDRDEGRRMRTRDDGFGLPLFGSKNPINPSLSVRLRDAYFPLSGAGEGTAGGKKNLWTQVSLIHCAATWYSVHFIFHRFVRIGDRRERGVKDREALAYAVVGVSRVRTR